MKNESKLKRYKNPEKQLEYINKWTGENYKNFTFRLHKIKDKEMIETIENRTVSLPELIRSWYKNKK